MKKLLALALASLLTASVALAQTTLTVGLFEPLNEHLERVMDQFVAENPGVTLDIRTLGYGDHHDALVTYLATGSGAPDVVAVEIGYIARFVAEGGLRDLSAEPFSADQYEDQFGPRTADAPRAAV
ncbi:MAG: extracellular solute-binding protein [Trueperaceae bacterium]